MLKKQTADRGGSQAWNLGTRLSSPHSKKITCERNASRVLKSADSLKSEARELAKFNLENGSGYEAGDWIKLAQD
jgi:hypothetical protein